MNRIVLTTLACCVLVGGCGVGPDEPDAAPGGTVQRLRVDPLPLQQARAYPETATGLFASLADFENAPGAPPGHRQVDDFAIVPAGGGASLEFVVNVTRTGAGAMEVLLPPGARLIYDIPHVRDFTPYTLLQVAVYSETLRDDLRVGLHSGRATWTSRRMLIEPGWNTVGVDVRRLGETVEFDPRSVKRMSLWLADAGGPVRLNVDDVMLIDNRRAITPVPDGITLRKVGLDYELTLPHHPDPLRLGLSADGLWRFGRRQTHLVALGPDEQPGDGDVERLALLGDRRVGRVQIVEHNAVRLRIVNTWYFPARRGECVSLAVRKVRWEHTFYRDGRWVTGVDLNNAGGRAIETVRLRCDEPVAVAGVGRVGEIRGELTGPVGSWSFLRAPPGARSGPIANGYVHPGRVEPILARPLAECDAAPDAAADDGFDDSQGCFFLCARRGGSVYNCRFVIHPPAGRGLWNPAVRVAGPFEPGGEVLVNSEGMRVGDAAVLDDGSVVFTIPDRLVTPTTVEVRGPAR